MGSNPQSQKSSSRMSTPQLHCKQDLLLIQSAPFSSCSCFRHFCFMIVCKGGIFCCYYFIYILCFQLYPPQQYERIFFNYILFIFLIYHHYIIFFPKIFFHSFPDLTVVWCMPFCFVSRHSLVWFHPSTNMATVLIFEFIYCSVLPWFSTIFTN